MFGLRKKDRDVAIIARVLSSEQKLLNVPPETGRDGDSVSPHYRLLQRWISFAEMQQRVIGTLAAEITRTSDFVETEADSLSLRFQRLATNAQQQTARVDNLTSLSTGIDVEGKTVRIDQITELFQTTLDEVVSKILLLSKDSMSMVDALEALGASVQNVGKCNASIDIINGTLNMLALNARIEGERAGGAGAAFRVVANEVYELSKTTKTLATSMKAELKAMVDGIMISRNTLARVAAVDVADDILVKERLEILLKSLVRNNNKIEVVVSDAVRELAAMSTDIAGMVTGIQFQDKTKQRLEHVVDTLQVIGQALKEIKISTTTEYLIWRVLRFLI